MLPHGAVVGAPYRPSPAQAIGALAETPLMQRPKPSVIHETANDLMAVTR